MHRVGLEGVHKAADFIQIVHVSKLGCFTIERKTFWSHETSFQKAMALIISHKPSTVSTTGQTLLLTLLGLEQNRKVEVDPSC